MHHLSPVLWGTHIQLTNHRNDGRIFRHPAIEYFLFTLATSEKENLHLRIGGKMGYYLLLQFNRVYLTHVLGKRSYTNPFQIIFCACDRFYLCKVSFFISINRRKIQQYRKTQFLQHIGITTERTFLVLQYFMPAAD